MRVVSLPSENVPAPPSPNWGLLSASRTPVCQKCWTSARRLSSSRPRSINTTSAPDRANRRAAKSPAGPMPTTSTRCLLVMGTISGALKAGAARRFLLSRCLRNSAAWSATSKSTLKNLQNARLAASINTAPHNAQGADLFGRYTEMLRHLLPKPAFILLKIKSNLAEPQGHKPPPPKEHFLP